MKALQSFIPVSAAYLTNQVAARNTSPHTTTIFHARDYGRFRRKELIRTNQGCNFLGGFFKNKDNVRAPIQFKRERESQLLKI